MSTEEPLPPGFVDRRILERFLPPEDVKDPGANKGRPRFDWAVKLPPLLEALAAGSMRAAACRAAEVPYSTFIYYYNKDSQFRRVIVNAERTGQGVLEEELRKRVVEGLPEYLTSGGKLVIDPNTGEPVTQMRKTDTSLIFALKVKDRTLFDPQQAVPEDEDVDQITEDRDDVKADEPTPEDPIL